MNVDEVHYFLLR